MVGESAQTDDARPVWSVFAGDTAGGAVVRGARNRGAAGILVQEREGDVCRRAGSGKALFLVGCEFSNSKKREMIPPSVCWNA